MWDKLGSTANERLGAVLGMGDKLGPEMQIWDMLGTVLWMLQNYNMSCAEVCKF